MDQEKLTTDLNKEIERDLGVKLPPPARPVTTNGNGQAQAPRLTHAAQIDNLIAEFHMTIRILEEAKKRL